MRLLKVVGVLLCVVAVGSLAIAAEKNMGIRDTYKVTFDTPMRVGTALLPAGNYVIRHTMEGQDHIMVFKATGNKSPEVKVKCTLVPLAQKAETNQTIYVQNAASERVLQELIFRGDTAKHVF